MKYIKKFETGEWNRSKTLEYCVENELDDCEECNWIRVMKEVMDEISQQINDEKIFKLIDIRGSDMYQGPYAVVKIFGKIYKMWNVESKDYYFIDDFFVNNNEDENEGFVDYYWNIIDLLKEINDLGGPEYYKNIKKFNV